MVKPRSRVDVKQEKKATLNNKILLNKEKKTKTNKERELQKNSS